MMGVIMRLRARALISTAIAVVFLVLPPASSLFAAEASVLLERSSGDVRVRAPGGKDYIKVEAGAQIKDGARLRTDADGSARLKYTDGSLLEIKPQSELIVRAAQAERPSGVVLFIGRVWAKIARSVAGETSFEVQSANAVAGVRGTEFEVGVGLDGSARVLVSEGEVKVAGESREESVRGGQAIESDQDRLGHVGKAPADPNWEGWFAERARRMEKAGLKVAKALDGRLNRRRAQVERLIGEQKTLRQRIESLESKKKKGADVEGELQDTLSKLERITERLEDMKSRLEGSFGLFERWGAIAAKGDLKDARAIGALAGNIQKIAADFADMIEEGTDQSPEGMEEMMDDMQKGKRDRPKDSAADELFR